MIGDKIYQMTYADDDSDWFDINGEYHNHDMDDNPIIDEYGTKSWYKHGLRHRDGDKPAAISSDGEYFWYQNGLLHREGDKPAIIHVNGTMECGPAVTHPNGEMHWYQHGKRHREDGPAVILLTGTEYWFKDGELIN